MSDTGEPREDGQHPLEKADPTGQSGAPVAVAMFVGLLVLVLLVLVVIGVVVLN